MGPGTRVIRFHLASLVSSVPPVASGEWEDHQLAHLLQLEGEADAATATDRQRQADAELRQLQVNIIIIIETHVYII